MALRDLTPKEVSELIDSGVILNEPGTDLLTRVLAKWFSSDNPRQAKEFLERRGFDVKETDRKGKLQFAIRHSAVSEVVGEEDNPWKVLDPEGFDMGDLADLAFDIFVVGPTIAASTAGGAALLGGGGAAAGTLAAPGPGTLLGGGGGALLGGAAGGFLGGAGAEAGRQFIGGLAGVTTKPDFGRIRTAGVLGAVLPGLASRLARFPQALLKVAKFANRKISNIGKNLAARVAGSSEEQITTAAANAQRTARIIAESETPAIALLDRMRGRIQQLRLPENRFPESVQMDSLVEKARPVPLKGLFEILQQRTVKPVGTQRIGVTSSQRMAQQISQRLGFEDAEEAAKGSISAVEAQKLKQLLQSQVDFSGRPGEKFLNKTLKRAQANLGDRIVAALPSPKARAAYRKLNGFASFTDRKGVFHQGRGVVGKMQALNELDKRVGEHKTAGTAEKFFEAVTGKGRAQDRRLVEQFDELFGTNFIEEGTITRLAAPFGRDAPKLTATGRFIGATQGAAAGFALTGTPEGAAGGAAVGAFVAATPKSMLRTARGLTKFERATRRGIRKAGRGLGKMEPLQDFLARRGGATAAASFPAPIQLEPAPSLTEQQKQGALRLVEEINALPNLTSAQKIEEFERRSQELISP